MLTFEERMDSLEALLQIIAFKYSNETATNSDRAAAVEEIWNEIDSIKDTVEEIETQLNTIREILSEANG